MEDKIKIVRWLTVGCDEPSSIYMLDEIGEGERFFKDLFNNAETDGREVFTVEEITQEELAAAKKLGEELA